MHATSDRRGGRNNKKAFLTTPTFFDTYPTILICCVFGMISGSTIAEHQRPHDTP